MRKRVLLALILVAALFVTSGCGLIVRDAEIDKLTPIIEVAGQVFTKGEVAAQVDYTLDYQAYIYSLYGYSFDRNSATAISDARDSVIEGLIQQAVTEQKIAEMGMDELTAEELAEVEATAGETYTGYIDTVKSSYFAETELEGEELDKAIEEKMVELGYLTKEELVDSEKDTKAQAKLKAEIVKDVSVTDEEIQTRYDENVASAQETYASTLSSYGTDVSNGNTVYYVPAGYRYVKHILRQISEDDSAAITAAETKVTEAQTRVNELEASIATLPPDLADDTDEEAVSRIQWEQELTSAQTVLSTAQAGLETVKEAAYGNLQPTIDEILQKLAEGADFDALMEEYGEDDGMKASPTKEQGYLVCEGNTQWVTEFTNGAMALASVGDVSAPVRTNYGVHILKYVSDVAEGAVPLDSLRDGIQVSILTEKQDELYNTTLSQWVTEANAKVNRGWLND